MRCVRVDVEVEFTAETLDPNFALIIETESLSSEPEIVPREAP
jgi:hypothetical protein